MTARPVQLRTTLAATSTKLARSRPSRSKEYKGRRISRRPALVARMARARRPRVLCYFRLLSRHKELSMLRRPRPGRERITSLPRPETIFSIPQPVASACVMRTSQQVAFSLASLSRIWEYNNQWRGWSAGRLPSRIPPQRRPGAPASVQPLNRAERRRRRKGYSDPSHRV